MKNKCLRGHIPIVRYIPLQKCCIFLILLFISTFLVNAQANNRNKISITKKKNVALNLILHEIENSSNYVFFYSDEVKEKLNQKMTLSDGSYTVEELLNKALSATDLTYNIVKDQISLLLKTQINEPYPTKNLQKEENTIKGKVVDTSSEPLPGVSVIVEGTTRGVMTDAEGNFELKGITLPVQLSFSYLGFETQRMILTENTFINITMKESIEQMEEVVITAWGVEKKTTMVGAVSSVKPKELKGPTSNLTTMLAGRVAGLVSYQLSGEPGRDNAEFFVRGVSTFGTQSSPLILINGIESSQNELARIQPDDIESFSILKDATATSMYGSRGANGVLLIKTKSGNVGLTKYNIRYESSVSSNTRNFEMADNITYMELANEARLTRGKTRLYNPRKIQKTAEGADPLLYPNNDWKEMMIKDNTWNHRVNLNISGGTERARYYVSGTYKVDNGMLKEHKLNDFDTNVKNSTMEVRSNIDLDLSSTTVASIRISGQFSDLTGPSIGSGAEVFKAMMKANPVEFPAVYPQEMVPYAKHPLFGNKTVQGTESQTDLYFNPYASSLTGYSETTSSALTAQVEVDQDFKFIMPGLKARFMAYTKREASKSSSRSVSPFYYRAIMDLDAKDQINGLQVLNPDYGREYLNYTSSGRSIWSENFGELALTYNNTFNDIHSLGITFQGYVKDLRISDSDVLERSLPQRNVSLSGRLTYGYDNRYLGEFNFGYNASERFDKNNRWGFFPSVGVAWNAAEESFMQSSKSWLDKLKLRLSYGIVGNDQLTDWINQGQDRYFYLDMVNMHSIGYIFGNNYDKTLSGPSIARYGNSNITWEKSYKANVALELGLFQGLNFEFDAFHDRRTNILLNRVNLPATLGLAAAVRANSGKLNSQGFETTLDYNKTLKKDMWLSVRGTFTYSTNEMKEYEEPEYPAELEHLYQKGRSWNVTRGYIAERLFIDEEDIKNSPNQKYTFGEVMPGDIKYRDVNGDGLIDGNDKVPMGYPNVPEIVYGFGFSFGYKDFDISAFFQGQARSSFMISYGAIQPFVKSGGVANGLLDVIVKDRWTEENKNSYAFFPRLSDESVANNNQSSSWWLRDGRFLRLKTLEVGYEPKGNWVRSLGMANLRIYVNAMNLFTISKFKMWDVEMKGDGLGYPLQRVINGGIQLSF